MREHQKQRSSWEALVHSLSIQVHTAFKAYYPKGAQIAKGQSVQNQQTVYAIAYPGKPKNEGPRTGLVARDFEGLGAIIIDIVDGSPATQVYDIKTKTFLSLRAQQVLISANGKTIEKADDWQKIVNDSPQIIRIGVRDAKTGDHEYLMRLRY
jgi:DNA-binding protein